MQVHDLAGFCKCFHFETDSGFGASEYEFVIKWQILSIW